MEKLTFDIITRLPDGLLDVQAENVDQILEWPTLISLPGIEPGPLFVSTLLHGNETTGFYAMQSLLKQYQNAPLPRAIIWFIGNVFAAPQGLRRLSHQPDYNRIWPGTELPESPETQMAAQIFKHCSEQQLFASIDVHNNTGLNPLYGCLNDINPAAMQLASLFSRDVIYFIRPCGVQSIAFTDLCPAVTIECGLTGRDNVPQVQRFLIDCLNLKAFEFEEDMWRTVNLYHTVATVKIPDHISFGFNGETADIQFAPEIQQLNFKPVDSGHCLGQLFHFDSVPLQVIDESGADKTSEFFDFSDGKITLKRSVVPAMITLDKVVIRQDCFCYLMEPYPRNAAIR